MKPQEQPQVYGWEETFPLAVDEKRRLIKERKLQEAPYIVKDHKRFYILNIPAWNQWYIGKLDLAKYDD